MARASQLSIVAGRQAVADAGLDWSQENRERVGVIMGTGLGCAEMLIEPLFKLHETGFARTNPFTALGALSNMPAFHVGFDNHCLGSMSTVVTACASGAQAIGDALEVIRRGTAEIMLAGGVEAQVTHLFSAGFRRYGTYLCATTHLLQPAGPSMASATDW